MLVIVLVLLAIAIPAITTGYVGITQQEAPAAKAHNLAIASFSYANDNKDVYPSGKTSTAIFQQLYDEKYLTEPGDVFLTGNGGKAMAQTSTELRLNPQNVSWDYTTRADTGLTKDDPEDTPLLFSCVAKVPEYKPGLNAVSLDAQCPWGNDGVIMVTLGQVVSFKRADTSAKVSITPPTFKPAADVVYQTAMP